MPKRLATRDENHEACDRASILHDQVERNLAEHYAVTRDEKAKALAERASQALFDLYQFLGSKL